MIIPAFYNFEDMTIPQWFEMLSGFDDHPDSEKTHVYRLETDISLDVNGNQQPKGLYFLRAGGNEVESLKPRCRMNKLTFSEIVYLSDIFSRSLIEDIPTEDEIEVLANKGQVSGYFDREIGSAEGLRNLAAKIKPVYFDDSLTGMVRRVLSAIWNFFRKYNLYIETGIGWPGDSCTYAGQVVRKMERAKLAFLKIGFEASKEQLARQLNITLPELEQKTLQDLKKMYHKKVLVQHPDKSPAVKKAHQQFSAINRVWGDYNEILRLIKAAGDLKECDRQEIEDLTVEFATPHRIKSRTHRLALEAPTPIKVPG
jgi:hypothetical protein